MLRIPDNTKQFRQVANSDIFGNIWSSFCLNFIENLGRIRVAFRGLIVTDSSDDSDFKTPVAFRLFRDGNNARIWTIAGKMFRNNGDPNDAFHQDTTSGTPNVNSDSDMENFNSALYVVGTTKIKKFESSSVWTEVGSNDGAVQTTTCVFEGRMYYVFLGSKIASIDQNDVVTKPSGTPNINSNCLDLTDFGIGGTAANTITSIRASSDRIWITTIDKTSQTHSAGRNGRVFEWDGKKPQADRAYSLDSIGALALIIKGDIPNIMNADGILQYFNGREFVEYPKGSRLPVPKGKYLLNPLNTILRRFIHPRGIALEDDKILVLINNEMNDSGGTIIENLPSGVWEFDEERGFTHRHACSQWKSNVTTQRTDFAQNRVREVGALFSAKSTSRLSTLNGNLLWGASYYTNATSYKSAAFINDTKDNKQKVGYFVTTKIESQNIEDTWQKIYVLHKKLLSSSDRIELKYRTSEIEPTETTITWTTTSTFTSTANLSAYREGDEVEITVGTGGGQVERITNIIKNGGVYTVALANAIIGASGTSKARFQKWIHMGSQTSQQLEQAEFALPKNSSWLQIKCVMYFTGKDEFNFLELINTLHKQNK